MSSYLIVMFIIIFCPPTVLLSAYCQWLPESLHQEVAKSWPPVERLSSETQE